MSDKYVLIVDVTSKGCFDCPAHQWVDDDEGGEMLFCSAENWRKPVTHTPISAKEALERPLWCPLRPLPEKKNTKKLQTFGTSQILWTDREIYQNEGYNMCIDEIKGEKDGSGN